MAQNNAAAVPRNKFSKAATPSACEAIRGCPEHTCQRYLKFTGRMDQNGGWEFIPVPVCKECKRENEHLPHGADVRTIATNAARGVDTMPISLPGRGSPALL